MPSPSRERRLAQLVTLGAAGVVAWWACAPIVGVVPSPAPFAEGTGQRGGGFAASFGPGIQEECSYPDTGMWDPEVHCDTVLGAEPNVLAGNLHYTWAFSERWELHGLLGGGYGSGAYLGAAGRYYPLVKDGLRLGLEGQLGGIWGAVGVPVAVRVGDDLWLTTNPSVGYRIAYPFRLPVGLSIDVSETVRMDLGLGGGFGGNQITGGSPAEDWGLWATAGFTLH